MCIRDSLDDDPLVEHRLHEGPQILAVGSVVPLEEVDTEDPHPLRVVHDLGSPDETYISSQFDKPVMIHRYPAASKAFYMQPDPADPTKALCVDVLAPEGYGEIIGGSQREERLDVLDARMAERSIDKEHYGWYRDLRRYGTVPHAGFGLGFERTLAYVTGLANVRDAIPFPRTPGNARY